VFYFQKSQTDLCYDLFVVGSVFGCRSVIGSRKF